MALRRGASGGPAWAGPLREPLIAGIGAVWAAELGVARSASPTLPKLQLADRCLRSRRNGGHLSRYVAQCRIKQWAYWNSSYQPRRRSASCWAGFPVRVREDRERVATYFDQIAACMREVAERIGRTGDPPRDTCRRLAVYANELEVILNARYFPITSGDRSIDDTRQRLTGQVQQVMRAWNEEGDVRQRLKSMAGESRRTSPEGHLDILISALADELAVETDSSQRIQTIWDASGEFAALADALRAR